ncbi:MAG TPA: hypothetical protein VFV92_01065 [Candidatus Bathyarchaeia archaeon]|nr:hypothetical protein [Candidatus Bathyarchaeia archaeon]
MIGPENVSPVGAYLFECYNALGEWLWTKVAPNVVTTVGRNFALDTYLSGVAYTVNGPYIGLIASTGFVGVSITDTMALHPGWVEAGVANNPHVSTGRTIPVFGAAAGGVKATSATAPFSITSGGTVKGGFLVLGPGASGTIDTTGGILYSAGLFQGGDVVLNNGEFLNVSYSAGLV